MSMFHINKENIEEERASFSTSRINCSFCEKEFLINRDNHYKYDYKQCKNCIEKDVIEYFDITKQCKRCNHKYSALIKSNKCCINCNTRLIEINKKLHFFKNKNFTINPFKRYVGLEIEVESPTFKSAHIPDNIFKRINIVYDGSLNNGKEITTQPMNGDKLFNFVDELSDFLIGKCSIDTTCGLHIHIDSRDLSNEQIEKVFAVYCIFEDLLFATQPLSRQNSRHTKRTGMLLNNLMINERMDYALYGARNERELEIMKKDKYNDNRYYFINLHSHYHRGTIEIRVHSGTTDKVKIKNWIYLNLALFEFALNTELKTIFKMQGTFENLKSIVKNNEIVDFYSKRVDNYNKDALNNIKSLKEKVQNNRLLNALLED